MTREVKEEYFQRFVDWIISWVCNGNPFVKESLLCRTKNG